MATEEELDLQAKMFHEILISRNVSASGLNGLLCEKVRIIFQKYLTIQACEPAAKCNGKCKCVLDKIVIDEILEAIQNTQRLR